MKKVLVGKVLCIVGGLLMGICLLGLFVPLNGEYSGIFWGALAGTLLGFTLCVAGGIIASLSWRTYPKDKKKYETYPIDASIDYQKELETVRANFNSEHTLTKNRIAIDPFPNSEPFYDFSVIESGKVYYSYLVQANSYLFDNKKFAYLTHPAVVIYSTEEYFEKNPLALKKIAHSLFEDRKSNGWGGKILNDEHWYFSNLQVPRELTDGHTVYMTTIMIYRRHLPLGYLSDSLLPIVASPPLKPAVFVVDVKYWTKPLIGNFVHGYAVRYKDKTE